MSQDSAIIAWIGILTLIVLYVVAYDVWALHTNHRTMTGQFRDWLIGPVAGPVIAGLWTGLFIGLTFHFVWYKNRGQ